MSTGHDLGGMEARAASRRFGNSWLGSGVLTRSTRQHARLPLGRGCRRWVMGSASLYPSCSGGVSRPGLAIPVIGRARPKAEVVGSLFPKIVQVDEIVGDRGGAAVLHSAVSRENVFAQRGELCTAAATTAGQRRDHRGTEVQVELFDELPGAAITHGHATTCCGDRAGFADAIEQVGFTRPEHHVAEADTQLEIIWSAHGGSLDEGIDALKPRALIGVVDDTVVY